MKRYERYALISEVAWGIGLILIAITLVFQEGYPAFEVAVVGTVIWVITVPLIQIREFLRELVER